MITSDLNRIRAAIAGPTFAGIQIMGGISALLANIPDGRGGRQTIAAWFSDDERPVVIRELVEVAS